MPCAHTWSYSLFPEYARHVHASVPLSTLFPLPGPPTPSHLPHVCNIFLFFQGLAQISPSLKRPLNQPPAEQTVPSCTSHCFPVCMSLCSTYLMFVCLYTLHLQGILCSLPGIQYVCINASRISTAAALIQRIISTLSS